MYADIVLVGIVSRNQEDNIQIVKEISHCAVLLITYVNVCINRKFAMRLVYPYITKQTNPFPFYLQTIANVYRINVTCKKTTTVA